MIGCLKVGASILRARSRQPGRTFAQDSFHLSPQIAADGTRVSNGACEIVSDLGIEAGEKNSDQLARALAVLMNQTCRGHTASAAASPAYIMFTSGSTGVPKGAVITHAAVLILSIGVKLFLAYTRGTCLQM